MKPQIRTSTRRGLFLGSKARRGFTLIELLIVISIIAILAAMIIPVTGAVNRTKIKSKAHTELEHIATAIELYKAKLGHYPPDNPNNPALNQLYFELMGTTNDGRFYRTLDGSATIDISTFGSAFGTPKIKGFVNSTQGGGG